MERRIERRGGLTTDDDDFPFFPPLLNRTPLRFLAGDGCSQSYFMCDRSHSPPFLTRRWGAASTNRGCVRALALITQISFFFSGNMGLIWSQYRATVNRISDNCSFSRWPYSPLNSFLNGAKPTLSLIFVRFPPYFFFKLPRRIIASAMSGDGIGISWGAAFS